MLRSAIIVLAATASLCASAQATVLIFDTAMANADWSASAIGTSGGFSFTAAQQAAGGNPGAYRAIGQFSTAGFAGGTVIHLHSTTWDPSSQGAISSLDMSVDVNCFNGGTSAAVAFGLVIVQGGTVYYGPTLTALTASGWLTGLAQAGMTSASFTSATATNPNLTGSGGLLSFGFYSSNGTGNGVPINSSSGADNFFVNIVPAPGALALLAMAGVAGGRKRRGAGRGLSERASNQATCAEPWHPRCSRRARW